MTDQLEHEARLLLAGFLDSAGAGRILDRLVVRGELAEEEVEWRTPQARLDSLKSWLRRRKP